MYSESYKSNLYPFSVWLYTILVSPLFLTTYFFLLEKDIYTNLGDIVLTLFIFIILGLLMSLPTVVLTVASYYILVNLKTQKGIIQMVNLVLGVAGIIITNIFMGGFYHYIGIDIHLFFSLDNVFNSTISV